jgi:hypothetical protein
LKDYQPVLKSDTVRAGGICWLMQEKVWKEEVFRRGFINFHSARKSDEEMGREDLQDDSNQSTSCAITSRKMKLFNKIQPLDLLGLYLICCKVYLSDGTF